MTERICGVGKREELANFLSRFAYGLKGTVGMATLQDMHRAAALLREPGRKVKKIRKPGYESSGGSWYRAGWNACVDEMYKLNGEKPRKGRS